MGVRRVAGVVYTVTADVLARLDELDASKPATKQMPCLGKSRTLLDLHDFFV